MIQNYYRLAKPGIVYGNTFTTIAGFLFASRFLFNAEVWVLFITTTVGIAFVIASAAVFNNYLDRDMDAKMERTSKRMLVTGAISPRAALIYGTLLGIIGFSILYVFVNLLTTAVALFGFLSYVLVYTAAKRRTHWAALIGTLPGAVPILAGYTAVANHIDLSALLLVLVLIAWQMPHFFTIAIYRMQEYVAASVPVLPAKKGIAAAKRHILGYIITFIAATAALFLFHRTGYIYLIVVLAVGLTWLWKCIKGFNAENDAVWAKNLFLYSLIVLVTFSVAIALGPILP